MKVRTVNAEDIWEVAKIENEAFRRPWTFPRFVEQYEVNREGFLVAEDHGKIVGFSLTDPEGLLMLIAVDSKHRGKGIGALLLEKSIEFLRKNRAKKAFAHVRPSNEKAVQFYTSHGFKKERLLKHYYSDEDGLLLSRRV